MWKYLIRRLLLMIPILIGVSIIVYVIVHIVPGNYIVATAKTTKMTPAQINRLYNLYGINDPMYIGYFKWIKNAVIGNLGDSFFYKKPVTWVLGTYVKNSFKLALPSYILELALAIPVGIISATRQYSKTDMTFTVLALVGISLPSFFFGYLLIKVFCVDFPLLPMSGLTTPGTSFTGFASLADQTLHLILPVIVLTVQGIGSTVRFTRTSMLEVVNQDYIRTARSKGLSEKVVIYKHALRNALIPIVTLIGLSLPGLFSGAIITETIFGIPGIGNVAYRAVAVRDYPLLMGFCMFVAVLTLLGNLISDILYAVVDPRVKLK